MVVDRQVLRTPDCVVVVQGIVGPAVGRRRRGWWARELTYRPEGSQA